MVRIHPWKKRYGKHTFFGMIRLIRVFLYDPVHPDILG